MRQRLVLLSIFFFCAAKAFSIGDKPSFMLPPEYVTGEVSVCPGVAYRYDFYAGGSCANATAVWNVTGGYITSSPGPGPGPIEARVNQKKNPGGDHTIAAVPVSSVWVMWTSDGTKSISCTDVNPCNNTNYTGNLISGIIKFKTGTAKPDKPTLPTIKPLAVVNFCPGDIITLKTTFSENKNGVTYDDVYAVWEASVDGGAWITFTATVADSAKYTVPSTLVFTDPNASHNVRFRVYTYFKLCTEGSSDPSNVTPQRTIFAPPPKITDSSTTPVICNDQGTFTIKSLDTQGDASTQYFIQIKDVASFPFSGSDLPYTLPITFAAKSYEYNLFYYNDATGAAAPCANPGTFTINDASYSINATATGVNESCPSLNNGNITLTHNGNPNFTYAWSKGGIPGFSTTKDLTGLQGSLAGINYSVNITDVHGCVGSASTLITEPTPVAASTTITKTITCFNGDNGEITVNGSGGTPGYTYAKNGGTFQSSAAFGGLTTGNYTFTVKDANGCAIDALVANLGQPMDINADVAVTNPVCNGGTGSVTVTNVTGGTGTLPTFKYSVDGGTFQASPTFSGLVVGTHTVRVMDGASCVKILPLATITQPTAIVVTVDATSASCSSTTDGQVTVTSPLGSQYTYAIGSTFQSSPTFTNLGTGTYTMTAKNNLNCTGSSSFTITSPTPVGGTINVSSPITCNGKSNGALDLTPSGGSNSYVSFVWSNGGTTEDINGLAKGTYSVTITDTKGCTGTRNITLTEPAVLNATAKISDYNGSDISCATSADGSIELSPSGGTLPYVYTWSNGKNTKDITNLAAGNYKVQIVDGNSCLFEKTIAIEAPPVLSLSSSTVQHVSCFGNNTGSVTLEATGGTAPHQYSANGGSTWQIINTFSNLGAGVKNYLVKDANNCQASFSVTITQPLAGLSSTETTANTTCGQSNGNIKVTAAGGTSPYTFQWFNSSNTLIGSSSEIASQEAGIYKMTITDKNGCTITKNLTISSSNGPVIASSSTATTCPESTDGSASITISGGQLPYTILWPNSASTNTVSNLAAGDYIVSVSDGSGCKVFKTVTVISPAAIDIDIISQLDPSCHGDGDGSITVQASGGNPGVYGYQWNTSATTSTITNLAAGSYHVSVNDSKGCTAESTIVLVDPPLFTIALGEDKKICVGQEVSIGVEITNATYSWIGPNDFESTSAIIKVSEFGTYSLTVTSEKGCEAQDQISLSTSDDLLKADLLMITQAFAGDTIIAIDISWPMPDYVVWTLSPEAKILEKQPDYTTFSFADPGIYTVQVTANLAQCKSVYIQSIEILERPAENGRQDTTEPLIQELSAFPNPFGDFLTLKTHLREEHEMTLTMIDLGSNKVLLRRSITGDHFEEIFNLSKFTAGLYVLVLKVGSETKSIKLMKK